MSRFSKLFAANAIAVAGLGAAAIALSATASAEPILPPVLPDVPALGMIQQLATNPASMGAVLQTAATALNGASAMVGGAPATLPVSPIQGAPGVPLTAAPIAPAATPGLAPLLNTLGFPASLAGLTPAPVAAPIAAPVAAPLATPLTAPLAAPLAAPAAAPLVAAPAGTAPVGQVLPLAALP